MENFGTSKEVPAAGTSGAETSDPLPDGAGVSESPVPSDADGAEEDGPEGPSDVWHADRDSVRSRAQTPANHLFT